MEKINLQQKFSLFDEHWNPKIVAELNNQHVKLAKLLGEFDWHHHESEDELFWVVSGELIMHFRDKSVTIGPGEMIVVPKGIEHKPEAKHEVQLVLFEPSSTVNTGSVAGSSAKTVTDLEWI
ncbi:MAG: cupin domain-containing protein [Planctomycetota bacterium]